MVRRLIPRWYAIRDTWRAATGFCRRRPRLLLALVIANEIRGAIVAGGLVAAWLVQRGLR